MQSSQPELIGYTDQLRVAPGERVRFMVSASAPNYDAAIVRLIHGDTNPAGPGFKEEEIATPANGRYRGRLQQSHMGSYVLVENPGQLGELESFTLQARIWPTTPRRDHVQGLLSHWSGSGGYALVIDSEGHLVLQIGDGTGEVRTLRAGQPLRERQWYFVAASFDATNRQAQLLQVLQGGWPIPDAHIDERATLQAAAPARGGAPFLIGAAERAADRAGTPYPSGCYNGKVENPRVYARVLSDEELERLRQGAAPTEVGSGPVAAWDFARDFSSGHVHDSSPNGLHGRAMQMPTRAMTGHNWVGDEIDYKHAPEQYGAIHFHEDDLEDAGWKADFEWTVPAGQRSGFYAARLRADGQGDYVPFWVVPARGARTAPIAYMAPTMTYLAYANERLKESLENVETLTDIQSTEDPYDDVLKAHPEWSSSIYDSHLDGSGIAYSTYLRPITPNRPTYRFWMTAAPRHYPADLYAVDWLESKGFDYDVITDHDLHHGGLELLSRFKVLVTGSHPEYWTSPMIAALRTYLDNGGRFMYLGGNGLYWITAVDPERPHVVEVRRGIAGTRTWESQPGELYHSATGELGGLWRYRAKAPNRLAGIGFASQGWDTRSPGYVRQPDSHDPRASWIFEGIGPDEVIGDFGLVMNGAVGDEIDRLDTRLGSPPHTLLLATTAGRHSNFYLVVIEDTTLTMRLIGGQENDKVRSDVVYYELPNGGAVFSTGSISYWGSLSHNNYQNNVSRMTENVLRRFST